MSDTLVLDSLGNPIRAIPWEKAITKVYANKARVLHEASDRILRSGCFEMGMPLTIQMRNVNQRKYRKLPLNRRNILIRDKSSCQYCGCLVTTKTYTMDHVLPRSKGGTSKWTNVVVACQACNSLKADKTLEESGLQLKRPPVAPSSGDPRFFKIAIRRMRPEWKAWESWLYWNIELDK